MMGENYIQKARKLNEFYMITYLGFSHDELEKKEHKIGHKELVEIARQHFDQRQFRISRNSENIWVVHPSCHEIDNGKRPKEVQRLLNYVKKTRRRYRTILVSDAIDYVINDYHFVEEGLFDNMILTKINQGKPLDLSDLDQFKNGKQNLVGGNYIGMCLDVFVETLKGVIPNGRIEVKKEWSYDPHDLTLGERAYKIFYSLAPTILKITLPKPGNEKNIFLPPGTLG